MRKIAFALAIVISAISSLSHATGDDPYGVDAQLSAQAHARNEALHQKRQNENFRAMAAAAKKSGGAPVRSETAVEVTCRGEFSTTCIQVCLTNGKGCSVELKRMIFSSKPQEVNARCAPVPSCQ